MQISFHLTKYLFQAGLTKLSLKLVQAFSIKVTKAYYFTRKKVFIKLYYLRDGEIHERIVVGRAIKIK
jgi:hypothetical protein